MQPWSILILYETIISSSNIDLFHAFAYKRWISILDGVERTSTRIKTPFDGLLLRQYIKLVVMVVWMQSATEQQNFICSTNLEGIMPSCQIHLDTPRSGDLHFVTYLLHTMGNCNKHEITEVPRALRDFCGTFQGNGKELCFVAWTNGSGSWVMSVVLLNGLFSEHEFMILLFPACRLE